MLENFERSVKTIHNEMKKISTPSTELFPTLLSSSDSGPSPSKSVFIQSQRSLIAREPTYLEELLVLLGQETFGTH